MQIKIWRWKNRDQVSVPSDFMQGRFDLHDKLVWKICLRVSQFATFIAFNRPYLMQYYLLIFIKYFIFFLFFDLLLGLFTFKLNWKKILVIIIITIVKIKKYAKKKVKRWSNWVKR